jgi:hypothetical protein
MIADCGLRMGDFGLFCSMPDYEINLLGSFLEFFIYQFLLFNKSGKSAISNPQSEIIKIATIKFDITLACTCSTPILKRKSLL